MYMHKPRGLNPGESYACSRMAVRKCFEQADLTVFWGDKRSFAFDRRMGKVPKIEGFVVASLFINRNMIDGHGILNFHTITDEGYGERQKKLFEDACLPRMKDWLTAKIQQGGKAALLVAWTGTSFRLQELQFA